MGLSDFFKRRTSSESTGENASRPYVQRILVRWIGDVSDLDHFCEEVESRFGSRARQTHRTHEEADFSVRSEVADSFKELAARYRLSFTARKRRSAE